jgi:hypothetical protein
VILLRKEVSSVLRHLESGHLELRSGACTYKRSPALCAGSHFCWNDRLKAEFKKLRTDRLNFINREISINSFDGRRPVSGGSQTGKLGDVWISDMPTM